MVSVFTRSLKLFVERSLSDSARSAALARFAKQDVERLIKSGRAQPQYEVFVDGIRGAKPESVRPDGVINYKFNVMGIVVEHALRELRRMSPYGPPKSASNRSGAGHYRDKFYVGINSRLILAANFDPKMVPADAEIVIGNLQPYSRKVDVRYIGFQKLQFASGEEQLFDKTARIIRRNYGGFVQSKRVYTMKFTGQYILLGTEKAGKPVESPALIIKPKGAVE